MFLGEGQNLALTNRPGQFVNRIAPAGRSADRQAPRFRGGLPPRVLRAVQEYIDAHLGETVSLDAMAGIAGLSPFHFCRVFKQSQGVSPHGYLIQRRVERAMELIAGTDLPLAEIASAVGFSDQSHCARSFRRQFGMSPREYRWSTR